jgi:hypothetical protein
MKRFGIILILLVALGFASCSKPYTTVTDGGTVQTFEVTNFCNLVSISKGHMLDMSMEIYCDKNTGVLYIGRNSTYHFGISPIMKADGTCLTLKEFEENYSKE